MKIAHVFIFTTIILFYGVIFSLQYQRSQEYTTSLDFALPVNFHKIADGYMRQLAAEMLFVRTSVFLGGIRPGTPPTSYANVLGNNFEVMSQLYPRFVDPYYFCQGFLTHISPESVARSNSILETGIAAHPNNFFFRMFYGTNLFLSMNEPLKGAKAFAEAAKLPNAPPMFGHLAAILSAQGGDITAGIISLRTMLASEKNEAVRTRYEEEIVILEQAKAVQKGVNAYIVKYGAPPNMLEQLVPEFLPQLPMSNDYFTLIYEPPNVRLARPDRTKKSQTSTP